LPEGRSRASCRACETSTRRSARETCARTVRAATRRATGQVAMSRPYFDQSSGFGSV
jgi:hypothetical protein